jgi:hypothetical protein
MADRPKGVSMKAFRKLAFIAFAALPVLAQAPQSELGVVRGTVVRAGSGEPITGATLTLSVEPPASLVDSMKSLASSMGLPAGEAQGALAQMLNATPEFIADELEGARERGIPAPFIAMMTQVLALKTETKGFPLRAVSDANGQFTFSGVPRGAFTLLARREGYFGAASRNAAFTSPSPTPLPEDVSLPVTVRELQTTVTVSLIPGAVISGRLRDVNGAAAANVPVRALELWYPYGIPMLASVRSVQTDDTGQFRVFGLRPGQYFLAATPAVSTGAFATFHPGSLEWTTAIPINLSAGQEVSSMDFSLQTARTVMVSGEITEIGSPATPRSLRVRLVRQPLAGGAPFEGTFPVVDGRKTAFELRGVPPGIYHLFANTAANFRNTTVVEVRDRDATGIQLVLRMNVTVTGTVTVDGATSPENAGARISLSAFDPDGKILVEGSTAQRGVAIAPDGRFSVPDRPWGRYAIRVIGLEPDAYVDEVQQGALNVYDTGVNVSGGADPITVKVKSNGGRIEGIVQTTDRKPLSEAVVVLIPPVARRRNPSLYMTAISDREGRFSLRGIQPGEYKVFAWESVPTGAWENAEFLAKYETQGRAVSIAPAAATQLEVMVAR